MLVGDGFVETEVLTVDWFGNVQLAAPATALARLADDLTVAGTPARAAATFGDVAPGDLVVFGDSAGHLAVAVNGGRAATTLDLAPGDRVRVAAR